MTTSFVHVHSHLVRCHIGVMIVGVKSMRKFPPTAPDLFWFAVFFEYRYGGVDWNWKTRFFLSSSADRSPSPDIESIFATPQVLRPDALGPGS